MGAFPLNMIDGILIDFFLCQGTKHKNVIVGSLIV